MNNYQIYNLYFISIAKIIKQTFWERWNTNHIIIIRQYKDVSLYRKQTKKTLVCYKLTLILTVLIPSCIALPYCLPSINTLYPVTTSSGFVWGHDQLTWASNWPETKQISHFRNICNKMIQGIEVNEANYTLNYSQLVQGHQIFEMLL